MPSYLLQGLILGATAAAQPGPFQAFLLSLIARDGGRRTLPAAFAPLISDGPILLLVFIILTQMPAWFLHVLRFAGGLFLIYLAWGAWKAFREASPQLESNMPETQGDWRKILQAALMNFLSPGPYIFWATVAGPIFIDAWRQSYAQGLSFLAGFYVALIGGFMLFIVIFGGVGRIDPRINRGLGAFSAVALFAFGVYQVGLAIDRLGMAAF